MSTQTQTIFFLGATGYLGSQFLLLLNKKLPHLPVVALLRNHTPERQEELLRVYSNITFVEGCLDDDAIIQHQVAKADIIINCASSDHPASTKSILSGLETNSKNNPGKPPLYIHVSGSGIVSDNVMGEPTEYVKEWSDIGLDLKECPPTNTHLESDIPIVEAGSRTDNPVRTIVYFPGQIYGVGEGVRKTTIWLRLLLDITKKVDSAGTWGKGANSISNVHIKDCAMGLFLVLQAALEGKADEGPEGLYFAASMEPRITFHDCTEIMGDYLYDKGVIQQGGTRPFPAEAIAPLGHFGWSILGGNHFLKAERLYKLGWESTETKRVSFRDCLLETIDQALKESE